MDIYGGTAILVIAATLLCAAVAKTRHLGSFELSLVRLLPRSAWRGGFTSRTLAYAVIVTELGTAAALFLSPPPWMAALTAWAAMLLALLSTAAIVMMRRRVPCSCFGASSGHPRLLDLARNFVLVLLACSATALTASGISADRYKWPTVGIAAVTLALVLISASAPRRIIASWVSGAVHSAGPASAGRRNFMRLAVGMVIGAAAIGALPAVASAAGLTCQDRYNQCYGCDPSQNECCIDCYVSCQDGPDDCGTGSCGGCWPVIV